MKPRALNIANSVFTKALKIALNDKDYESNSSYKNHLTVALNFYNISIDHEISGNLEAYIHRGILNMRLKKFTDALKDFTKTIELDPSVYEHYYNRSLSYMALNQLDNAINDLDEAIRLDSENLFDEDTFLFVCRGDCYRVLGDVDLAEKNYRRAELIMQQKDKEEVISQIFLERSFFKLINPYSALEQGAVEKNILERDILTQKDINFFTKKYPLSEK